MSKILRKMTSLLVVMGMSTTTLCIPAQAASHYATNPSGYGVETSIKIDGQFDDWTGDMLIAQGVANDDARIFRGSHEGPVYDSYALYSAWDDENLYLMWQFVNVTDVTDPAQDYPQSDNGKPWNGDIPQIIALSIDPGKSGNGKCINGDTIDDNIWGINVNYDTPVDTLLYFSSKPGVGKPSIFKVNEEGYFDYSTAIGFKEAGISYKYGDGLHSSIKSVMGIKANGYGGYTPNDLYGETSFSWVDMLKEGHSKEQDTMYEMAIPLKTLGITKEYIEKNGIGAMHISTFGQSGIASVPHDKSMLDVATQPYTPDESTSAEKEDTDVITAALAEIGTSRSVVDKDDTETDGQENNDKNQEKPDTDESTTGKDQTADKDTTGQEAGNDEVIDLEQASYIPVSQIGTGSSTSIAAGGSEGLAGSVDDGTILHAWNWSLKTIKEKLPEIAAAGYTTVQTSPLQGTKEDVKAGSKWWILYQPTNFEIGNAQLGSRDDLLALCKEADKYGIKIIVDVIFNHTANSTGDDISPMVDAKLRNNSSFWHYPLGSIQDYGNRWQVTQKDVGGLPDLNTSNKELQYIIIDYLKDLIACGVDGFRVDTAKHIELPTDNPGSDFWPTIKNAISGDDVFIYGEVLQGGADHFAGYAPYINETASNYGYALRNAVGFGAEQSVSNVSDYSSSGVDASKLVTFVETHDNYANDQCESTYMTDWQIKMGWAITASRAYVTPLYFNRPTANAGTSKFAALLGTAGNDNWKDADTVAVNKFHNAMVGEGEKLNVINNKLLMIERGSKGVVLVNLGGQTAIDTATSLLGGSYANHGSMGGTFTVENNKLSGTVPAGGIVVLYQDQEDGASVGITGAGSTFKTDTMKIALGAKNVQSATYSIDGGSEVSYQDGDIIAIGAGKAYNTVTTVTVKGKNGDSSVQTSCKYIKLDPQAERTVYFDNSSMNWSKVNAYVYDDTAGAEAEAAKWPGTAMKDLGNGLYSYTVPSSIGAAKVIFNDGADKQTPPAKAAGYSVTSPMIYTQGEMCYYIAPAQEQNKPAVSILPAASTFKGSSLTLTLGAKNTQQAVYSINEGEEIAYEDGEKITINGIKIGQSIKITLKASNDEGSTEQTYTYTNTDQTKPVVYEDELKVFCYKPENWGDSLNMYIYDETSTSVRQLAAWPGVQMTAEGDGLYSYELDESWKDARVIFNDGSNQYPVTEGLLLDCSRYYEDGAWNACEVIENNELAVAATPESTTYKGKMDIILSARGSQQAVYAINDGEPISYTDGQHITIGEEAAPGETTTLTLTATDAEGKVATQTYTYVKEENEEAAGNIYFNKPSNWGENINVYVYDETGSNVKELAAWPGIQMTKESDGSYSYTLPSDWKYAQVIFNDGSSQLPGSGQPGFVYNGTSMIYKEGAWKAFKENEETADVTAYFDNNGTNWSSVNAYVYDESNGSVKEIAPWPGLAMTNEGNNIFSYTVKEDWEDIRVIFNNGSAQIPSRGQSGFSLKANMMYSNAQWMECVKK